MLKQNISNPYNFQHLTHTGTHHGKLLRTASENDMVIEFSAIRAAQAPRKELKGIRADSLHSKENSPLSQPPSPTRSRGRMSPSPSSAGMGRGIRTRFPTTMDSKSVVHARSVQSFQRVSSKSFSSLTPPLSPPARRSSRAATTTSSDYATTTPLSPTKLSFSQTSNTPVSTPLVNRFSAAFGASLPALDSSTVGNAVTTPDDTAYALGPPTHSSSCAPLAGVPEEEDIQQRLRASIGQWPATANPAMPDTKSSSSSSLSNYRNERLVACIKSSASITRNASDPTLPLSAGEVEEIPNKRQTLRFSKNISLMDYNWEDDVDYCYEHAAEADCAFDWDRASNSEDHVSSSTETVKTDGTPNSSFEYAHTGSDRSSLVANGSNGTLLHGSLPPSFLRKLQLRQPSTGLDTPSPHSTLTSPLSDVVTPSDSMLSSQVLTIASRNSQSSAMSNFSPALLIPQEYESRMSDADSFQEKYCTTDDMKHPQYAIYTPSLLHREDSLCSTESPLSNCNSRESIIVTRPSSIDPFHRSTSSIGSLPELVYSRTTREKFEVAADQLASHLSHMTVGHSSSESSLRNATEGHSLRRLPSAVSISASISEEPEEFSMPMPGISTSQTQRDRSNSHPANRLLNMASATVPTPVGRSRSATVGGKSRGSYSLFPTATR